MRLIRSNPKDFAGQRYHDEPHGDVKFSGSDRAEVYFYFMRYGKGPGKYSDYHVVIDEFDILIALEALARSGSKYASKLSRIDAILREDEGRVAD